MAEKNTKGAISIRNVTKIYDPEGVNVMAVDDCSLEIKSGEVCMIVGPSGCGKTTLLNAIAGFHSITEGEIYLDNEILIRFKLVSDNSQRRDGFYFDDLKVKILSNNLDLIDIELDDINVYPNPVSDKLYINTNLNYYN